MAVENYDFLSLGGGAAGFFGAISFAEEMHGGRVAILEKGKDVLGKVKISGGGRCNVTHACFEPKPMSTHYPRGEKSLIGPFHRWGVGDTVDWFESRGVKLKTESDGRMFPTTDLSQTIIDCLTGEAESLGVEIRVGAEVERIERTDRGWTVSLRNGGQLETGAVMLSTGGIRNGAGSRIASSVGHTVKEAAPSLFTFKISDDRLEGLSGISVPNVVARIRSEKLMAEGPCLVTHWGLSGPAILRLSAWGARALAEREYRFEVEIDWTGGNSAERAETLLFSARESHPRKKIFNGIATLPIPARLWQSLACAAGIDSGMTWANLGKEARKRLAMHLVASRFSVSGKSMNKDEFVTAGGVELKEVDLRTMESKIAEDLYFAGEVLDIDGITGGFNFQSAWTTARLAGTSAARKLAAV